MKEILAAKLNKPTLLDASKFLGC